MHPPAGITRVIVVVLDGLRADAIPLFPLPRIGALAAQGAATLGARTVTPSVTAAAMTSLLTGVSPRRHGVEGDRFGIPRAAGALEPLPAYLRRHGVPTHAFMAALPRAFRGIGRRIADRLETEVCFAGTGADQILAEALTVMGDRRPGLFLLHWPDADDAGHAAGWSSPQYAEAAGRLDAALGRLVAATGVETDPETVLIALADHGGGGTRADAHDSPHPLDTTIPIVLAGGQVARGELAPASSLLDVSATVPWLFGVPVPSSYQGRVLVEAIEPMPARAGSRSLAR